MKILYFDTETTGLSDNSAIIQIGGIIEIDGKIVKEFNIFSQPHEGADISKEALAINGITLEQIGIFQTCSSAYKELKNIFDMYIDKYDKNDKFIVAGYNVEFDVKKLSSFFKNNNDNFLGSYIIYRGLDPLNWILPLQMLGKLPTLKNNKLSTWCEHFNIELEAHNALNDIRATKLLISIFMSIMYYEKLN